MLHLLTHLFWIHAASDAVFIDLTATGCLVTLVAGVANGVGRIHVAAASAQHVFTVAYVAWKRERRKRCSHSFKIWRNKDKNENKYTSYSFF